MGSGPGRLHATALVDGHIHNDRALLHLGHHGAGHDAGSGRAGNEDAADHQVGLSRGVATL